MGLKQQQVLQPLRRKCSNYAGNTTSDALTETANVIVTRVHAVALQSYM